MNVKVNFIRFADEFIITGYSREMLEKAVMPAVESFMRESRLLQRGFGRTERSAGKLARSVLRGW